MIAAMRLVLIPKSELTEAQNRLVEARLAAPEHAHDASPKSVWNVYQPSTLYAFFREEDSALVGVAEASGPLHAVSAGWWIDSKFRGQKHGNELVDLLASHLKARGFTGVGRFPITGRERAHQEASIAMAARFKAHFRS